MRISAEVLQQLYVDEQLTSSQVAARIGSSSTSVLRWLRLYGLVARPRGPRPGTVQRAHVLGVPQAWSSKLAWAVGIIATDGNLTRGKAKMCVPSKDLDLLELLRESLGLDKQIARRSGPRVAYQLQWGSRAFYDWLVGIGLTPAKSLTLGALKIPDEWFVHFFRGCIDGDGSIVTYIDRYNTRKKPTYVYVRLYVSIVSASRPFIEWLEVSLRRLTGVAGSVTLKKRPVNPRHHDVWCLKYAKRESLALARWMYADPGAPHLQRKYQIAAPFLARRELSARRGPGRPMVV